MFAKFQGRDVSLCLYEFSKKNFRRFQLTFPNSSNRTVSTVNLSKLPFFHLDVTNKNSIMPWILAPFWSNVIKLCLDASQSFYNLALFSSVYTSGRILQELQKPRCQVICETVAQKLLAVRAIAMTDETLSELHPNIQDVSLQLSQK